MINVLPETSYVIVEKSQENDLTREIIAPEQGELTKDEVHPSGFIRFIPVEIDWP